MSTRKLPALTPDEEFIAMLQATLPLDGGPHSPRRVADQVRARLHTLVDRLDAVDLGAVEVALRKVVGGGEGRTGAR
jgi:hypothetical protein